MSEIEKQFFEVFGIEPIEFKSCSWGSWCPYNSKTCDDTCVYWDVYKIYYPQITDHILLELICIAHTSPVITFTSRDIKDLKVEVLVVLCNCVNHRDIKHQVQALFKEDN